MSRVEITTAGPPAAVAPMTGAKSPGHCLGSRRKHHRAILAGCGCVLLLSLLLEVVPDGRVAFRGLESYPLPHTCSMRLLFDRGCPGCGMTRGFIHLANGRLQDSLAVHPLAWLLFTALLAQFPLRAAALRRENAELPGKRLQIASGWALIGLLLLNWCWRMIV